MSNSSEEIEKLRREVILIAKTISRVICQTNYNIFLHHFRGEEHTSYVERWKKEAETTMNLEITPEVIARSMDRVEYTTNIDPVIVQETIDYMVELGYIKEGIKAADILDLRYLQSE